MREFALIGAGLPVGRHRQRKRPEEHGEPVAGYNPPMGTSGPSATAGEGGDQEGQAGSPRSSLRVPLVVGLATAIVYFGRLGQVPLVDASEGFHVAIAREMAVRGDWITPHFDGIRYFDKPPLLYWLMAAGFQLVGRSEWSARFWTALAVVGTAALIAWLGTRLGSERLGLIAGLLVAVNMEVFLFGRLAKPDLLFVFFIVLAFAGFITAYQRSSPRALLVSYASLGAAVMTKDFLGALGPLAVFALFLSLTRQRFNLSRWVPWAGVALLLLLAVPWHLAVEWRNPGFLWYMVIDNHVFNLAGFRAFPDEDVPLTAAEFLGVTAIGFLPWSLALPWVFARSFWPSWRSPEARTWLLIGLWAGGFLAAFALSPFKLPHYGLPAVPALALLAAKVWDDALAGRPGAPSPRTLLVPPLVILAGLAAVCVAVWKGGMMLPSGTLSMADLHSRNLSAQGQHAPFIPFDQLHLLLPIAALTFGLGSLGIAVAVWRRRPGVGFVVLLAFMLAFLPLVSHGFTLLARSRSAQPITELLTHAAGPDDVIVHEGPLENTGSLVLAVDRPVRIVDGMRSNLAFGATFPEAREIVWDTARLRQAWQGRHRVFLVSIVKPERSVVRELPEGSTHLLLGAGGRRLYSNRSGAERR
jgi:4-amino-4-deoxy-L-arabinose transferase-like glycosyltransferase